MHRVMLGTGDVTVNQADLGLALLRSHCLEE